MTKNHAMPGAERIKATTNYNGGVNWREPEIEAGHLQVKRFADVSHSLPGSRVIWVTGRREQSF